MGLCSRSIAHYPTLPLLWPVKFGTNLTKEEVEGFEALGFVLEDRVPIVAPVQAIVHAIVPKVEVLETEEALLETGRQKPTFGSVSSDGDGRPKFRNRKLFLFVAVPSPNHILKMESSKFIDFTILKLLKVPNPGYGVVFTVIMPGSILKKELYEVIISNFPTCTCSGFQYMCASVLGNPKKKWILCKHLYFILQKYMFCTFADVFVHYLGWTPNEVRLLIEKMKMDA